MFDRRFTETVADDRIAVVFDISGAAQTTGIDILMAFDRV